MLRLRGLPQVHNLQARSVGVVRRMGERAKSADLEDSEDDAARALVLRSM